MSKRTKTASAEAHKPGDLRVWWVPQVPMKSFEVPVSNLREARLLLNALAKYDLFQFENRVKPDYCNAGGLTVWSKNMDGEGTPGWIDWHGEDCLEFDDIPDSELDTVKWEEA